MNEEQFYSDEQAEAILREASRLERPLGNGHTKQTLLATAAELGISPEAVEAAEQRVKDQQIASLEREEFERARRSKSREQLLSFLGLAVMLFGINLFTNGFSMHLGSLWAIYPVGLYGVVLISDLIQSGFKTAEQQEAAFEKWREKRQFKAGIRAAFLPRASREQRVDDLLDHYFSIHQVDDKIGAIKAVRESTGLGLRDAKMLVEEYYRMRGLS